MRNFLITFVLMLSFNNSFANESEAKVNVEDKSESETEFSIGNNGGGFFMDSKNEDGAPALEIDSKFSLTEGLTKVKADGHFLQNANEDGTLAFTAKASGELLASGDENKKDFLSAGAMVGVTAQTKSGLGGKMYGGYDLYNDAYMTELGANYDFEIGDKTAFRLYADMKDIQASDKSDGKRRTSFGGIIERKLTENSAITFQYSRDAIDYTDQFHNNTGGFEQNNYQIGYKVYTR